MPLLLSSKGFLCKEVENLLKKEFINKRTSQQLSKIKIGIITTAILNKERDSLAIKSKIKFEELGFSKANISFFDFDFDNIKNIDTFSVIYICGGNPYYLLNSLKLSNGDTALISLMKKKKLFLIGVSAGSLIACPDIEVVNYFTPEQNNCNLSDFKALNLTDKYVFPHSDRLDLFNMDIHSVLNKVEKEKGCSFIRLKDSDIYFEP